jgi:hypothetical protein
VVRTSAVGHLLTHCSALRRHETQLTLRPLLGLTPSARAALEVKPQANNPMDKYFGSKNMNEADVTKTHAATIDALNELAASLIRSGAPVDAVQKFVDAEIDRIEFMQGKNR